MFVRYFSELPIPFEPVEGTLVRDPGAWVPGIAHEAENRRDALMAEAGFGDGLRLEKRVEIELGEPVRLPSKTVLPLRWSAAGGAGLFPTLEADLEVAALGPNRTQLSINARYTPPLGKVGAAIDRAMLHRVAEATLKDFLDRVERQLLRLVPSSG